MNELNVLYNICKAIGELEKYRDGLHTEEGADTYLMHHALEILRSCRNHMLNTANSPTPLQMLNANLKNINSTLKRLNND